MYTFECNNFNIHQIADSGQTFRWYPEKEGYIIVAKHHVARITQMGSTVMIEPLTENQNRDLWYVYLGLDEPYENIITTLKGKDDFLDAAISFGSGIRILKQDPFEMVVTFILSANNNIKRITTTIHMLSEKYGRLLYEDGNHSYYDFPTLEQFSELKKDDYRVCGAGYRDDYLNALMKSINSGFDLENLKNLEDQELKETLKRLKGVGEKVANCILLFGYGRYEGFPIDTWMKKVILANYDVEEKNLQVFSEDYFKPFGGIAQQYLFYYGRKLKI